MIDPSASLNKFLEATAAREPTPGGGAVAALCGALSVAIGEMVLNYSVGRKANLVGIDEKLTDALKQFTFVRAMFLELMMEDQMAFEELSTAKKSNAPSDEIATALTRCITVPRAIAGGALSVLKSANEIAPMINRQLSSDLAVCGELAMATLRSALHSVRINLPELDDQSEIKRLNDEADHLLKRAVQQIKNLEENLG